MAGEKCYVINMLGHPSGMTFGSVHFTFFEGCVFAAQENVLASGMDQ